MCPTTFYSGAPHMVVFPHDSGRISNSSCDALKLSLKRTKIRHELMIMAENNHKAALTGEYLNQMPLFTTLLFFFIVCLLPHANIWLPYQSTACIFQDCVYQTQKQSQWEDNNVCGKKLWFHNENITFVIINILTAGSPWVGGENQHTSPKRLRLHTHHWTT